MTASLAISFIDLLASVATEMEGQGVVSTIQLARRIGVGGFVRRHGSLDEPGGPDGHDVTAKLNERLLVEAAEEISATMSARGIPHFFLKGVGLSGRVYGIGDRDMVDIDMQVAPTARRDVVQILEALGYEVLPDRQQDGPAELRVSLVLERVTGPSGLSRTLVDLRWGIDPVERFLPRPYQRVPDVIWQNLDTTGAISIPSDAHHAALIMHHLVHHDMLHIRGLLDLALLWNALLSGGGSEVEVVARELRVRHAALVIGDVLTSVLGLPDKGISAMPTDWRSRRLRQILEPVSWFAWVAAASEAQHDMITPKRIARRLLLLDSLASAPGLLAETVFPPRAFLRWRWPQSRSSIGALIRHLGLVASKLAPF